MKCKCDFRTFMVGDGCDVCNPAKALEYARETIDEQAALIQEMGEALREAVDLAWVEDSHAVRFDSTVLFGPCYDFENLDGFRRQEFLAQYDCVVWPGNKWSAYCTYEGSMWFEQFDSAEEAKDACMQLLDRVLPEHPAMKARATLAKWKESK